MSFQVEAFNTETGEPSEPDNFFRTLVDRLGGRVQLPNTDLAAEEAERLAFFAPPDQGRQSTVASRPIASRGADLNNVTPFDEFLRGDPITEALIQPEPGSPEAESRDAFRLVRDFLEDQGEVQGLEQTIAALDAEIERFGAPLRQTNDGRPRAVNDVLEGFSENGLEGAQSARRGYENRVKYVEGLFAERNEVAQTLAAMSADGDDPESAFYRYLRDAGVNTGGISTPEAAVSRMVEAVETRAEDAYNDKNKRYDSGLSGVIGTNVDGFYSLVNQDKLTLVGNSATPNFENFEGPNDYVDYFGLAFRFNQDPVLFDGPEGQAAINAGWESMLQSDPTLAAESASITLEERIPLVQEWKVRQGLLAIDPSLANRPTGELSLIVKAVLDRIKSPLNYSSAGGLEDWAIVNEIFGGTG